MSSSSQHKPGSIGEMIAVALPMVVSFACATVMIFTDRLLLLSVSYTHLIMAIIHFVLAAILWFVLLGWIIHLWSILDAAKFKPKN